MERGEGHSDRETSALKKLDGESCAATGCLFFHSDCEISENIFRNSLMMPADRIDAHETSYRIDVNIGSSYIIIMKARDLSCPYDTLLRYPREKRTVHGGQMLLSCTESSVGSTLGPSAAGYTTTLNQQEKNKLGGGPCHTSLYIDRAHSKLESDTKFK